MYRTVCVKSFWSQQVWASIWKSVTYVKTRYLFADRICLGISHGCCRKQIKQHHIDNVSKWAYSLGPDRILHAGWTNYKHGYLRLRLRWYCPQRNFPSTYINTFASTMVQQVTSKCPADSVFSTTMQLTCWKCVDNSTHAVVSLWEFSCNWMYISATIRYQDNCASFPAVIDSSDSVLTLIWLSTQP